MKKLLTFFSIFSLFLGISQNLITNGDFSNGTASWAGTPFTVVAGEAFFSSTNAGGNLWDTQLVQAGMSFTAGVQYTVSFKARAASNRTVEVAIQNVGIWSDQFRQNYALTTTMQTFSANFIAPVTNANVQIGFLMAGQGSTAAVYFDDVVIQLAVVPPAALPLIQDFETASSYTAVTGFGSSTAAVVADPTPGGANGQVFQATSVAGGQVWQGVEFVQTSKRARLTTNKTMQVDVYSTQAFNILGKVEVGGPASANGQAYTTPGQWQTLTFNFAVPMDGTVAANGDYEKIIFFGNWNATNTGFNNPPAGFVFYVDNIRAMEAVIAPPSVPMVPAPTPPARPAEDVISIYSNAYANIPVNEWGPQWSGAAATITDFPIDGNETKVINMVAGKDFAGIDFAPNKFNATEFTHIHIDYWMTEPLNPGQIINIKLSNHDGAGETSAIQYLVNPPVVGQWVSLDIPLADFGVAVANASRNNIAQIVLSLARANVGSTSAVTYIDNIYFHKNSVTPPPPTVPMVAAPTPPARFPEDVVSIFSDAYANIPVNEWGPNWGAPAAPINDFPINGNATKVINMGAGQTFAGIDFAPNKFNATPFTHFHLDYWTPAPLNVGQVISIKLSNHDGAGETNAFLYTVTAPTASQWVQLDIPLSAFTPVTNSSRANMAQIVITAGRADNGNPVTIYFDNVYFWKAPGLVGPVSLRDDFCNTTLQTVDQQFFAKRLPAYNTYIFEVKNMTTNEIVTVNRGDNRGFRLTQHAPSIVSYNTVYQVRVKASNANEELPYGSVCTITTPAIHPQITLRSNSCDITVSTLNQVIYSQITPLANEYTFEVKNIDTNITEEFVSNTWFFNLSQLEQSVSYGDAFEIRVKSKVNGVSNAYGGICTIAMPTSMVANLTSLYCNQSFNSHRTLYANRVNQAQEYTFEVTNSNDETIEVVRSVNFFHILYHTSTDFYGTGGSFDIKVKVKVNNTYGDYDQTCNVFFGEPGLLNSLSLSNINKIEAYPNPFTNEFNVRLATVDFATVQLFDINGRLIENRQVQNEFEITMGQELNAGVYLVRVEQNGEVQSFKMIKK